MRSLRYLLLPFSILYYLVTSFRNHLFDIGYTKSFKFEVKTIGVGNLSSGGSGKSPLIEYLIRLLKNDYKIATLSRGYGRKSSGFILGDNTHTSKIIGDEPRQFYLKFKEEITVSVGEDRAVAIPEILFNVPQTNVILMDDVFQHRYVSPGINILLSDYQNLLYQDFLLPMGNLRESRKGAKRADILIITKCPENISEEKKLEIRKGCQEYLKEKAPVFFSTIFYLPPVPVFKNQGHIFSGNVFLFTGIGKSNYVEQYAKDSFNLRHVVKFADHHSYTLKDLEKIKNIFEEIPGNDNCLLTTEKDVVKIKDLFEVGPLNDLPFFYLPIEMKFVHQQQDFERLILNYLKGKNY
ncbi:MAG: tetraacyldisaccharide 4'-kinase [Bacteroidota bacterium]|nr:tetraacyldisaccharide 4'-kinase [Bacteroidota bacterium]